MKQILTLALSAILIVTACSKKKDDATAESNSVIIGGKEYSTVTIGTQIWTSTNYNGDGGVNYNNGTNSSTNGKLYTLAEAKAVSLPSGWRLPTKEDYEKLLVNQGGTKPSTGDIEVNATIARKLIPSSWTNGANGTNTSGFNALPVGVYANSQFEYQGDIAAFWTSSTVVESSGIFNYSFGISNAEDGGIRDLEAYLDWSRPADKLSIRFVKNK